MGNQTKEYTIYEELLFMRNSWSMFAITREAFVVHVGFHLGIHGPRELSLKCLSKNGNLIDSESCKIELDETFAHFVVDEALQLLAARVIES